MTQRNTNSVVAMLAIVAVALAACGKDKPEVAAADALADDKGLLRYVPADTPYVFGNLEPLPDDVLDRFEPTTDAVLRAYQDMLGAIADTVRAEIEAGVENDDGDAADAGEALKAAAFIDELSTLMSMDAVRGAGIARESVGVIYGNGLLPVARLTLSDPAQFDATISRLEEKAGHELAVASVDGRDYRYFDGDDVRFIIATIDDQAIMTLAPAGFDDQQLGRLLGLELPARNIADSGELADIAKEYGYTAHYIGLISSTRIAETFLEDPTGMNADLLAAFEAAEPPALSDVCKSEIRSVVSVAPRIVMGYSEISTKRMTASAIVEMRDDIAAGLMTLPASVPGLGSGAGALMSFGLGLDPMAAREFYEARLDAMEAEPFECELFAELQAGVPEGRAMLNQPVPPMAYDFRGFLAVIDNISEFDMASGQPPREVDASLMLAMENAEALVMMGAMMMPALAELQLEANGVPVALDPSMLAGSGMEQAWVALGENALAVAVGENAEKSLGGMLDGALADPAPFMSMSMDGARYFELMAEFSDVQFDEADADNEQAQAVAEAAQAAGKEVNALMAELYDRIGVDIYFTSNGIELRSDVTMK